MENPVLQYGSRKFFSFREFFVFLKLQENRETLLNMKREIFKEIFGKDSEGFSNLEKFIPEISPCRLSPEKQLMSGVNSKNSITPEKLNQIFVLALNYQNRKKRESRNTKIVSKAKSAFLKRDKARKAKNYFNGHEDIFPVMY